jgi:hypothetical protein
MRFPSGAKVRHAQAHPLVMFSHDQIVRRVATQAKYRRNDRMLAGSISAERNQFREGTLVPASRENFLIFLDGLYRADHHAAFMTASGTESGSNKILIFCAGTRPMARRRALFR